MKNTLKTLSLAAPILLLAALPLSAAEGIGGQNEKPLEVEGTVVDLLCEVAKRCAPNCGEGKRQLGIKLSDGKLLVAGKNTDLFAGSAVDLAPHCGKTIKADGILFENPKMPFYMVQGIKTDPKAAEYSPVDGFVKAWVAKNGATDEWFRNDPIIKAQIAKNGPLGRIDLKPKAQ
ncbi:MAG: hypothetical protein ACKVON_09120 [Beijerinckiaceae bacterium]